jgi:alanine racemase
MSLTLHVDGARWRAHLHATLESMPGLVPVAKGNGYGFGLRVLAAEAARLGVPSVAVGEAGEVAQVRAAYDGDVLVLAPWRPERTWHRAPTSASYAPCPTCRPSGPCRTAARGWSSSASPV